MEEFKLTPAQWVAYYDECVQAARADEHDARIVCDEPRREAAVRRQLAYLGLRSAWRLIGRRR